MPPPTGTFRRQTPATSTGPRRRRTGLHRHRRSRRTAGSVLSLPRLTPKSASADARPVMRPGLPGHCSLISSVDVRGDSRVAALLECAQVYARRISEQHPGEVFELATLYLLGWCEGQPITESQVARRLEIRKPGQAEIHNIPGECGPRGGAWHRSGHYACHHLVPAYVVRNGGHTDTGDL